MLLMTIMTTMTYLAQVFCHFLTTNKVDGHQMTMTLSFKIQIMIMTRIRTRIPVVTVDTIVKMIQMDVLLVILQVQSK